MTIEPDQKKWITNVVKELGTAKKVKQLYNKNCGVDKWANALAQSLFGTSTKLRRRTSK